AGIGSVRRSPETRRASARHHFPQSGGPDGEALHAGALPALHRRPDLAGAPAESGLAFPAARPQSHRRRRKRTPSQSPGPQRQAAGRRASGSLLPTRMNRRRSSAPSTPPSVYVTLVLAALVATTGGALHAVCKN